MKTDFKTKKPSLSFTIFFGILAAKSHFKSLTQQKHSKKFKVQSMMVAEMVNGDGTRPQTFKKPKCQYYIVMIIPKVYCKI